MKTMKTTQHEQRFTSGNVLPIYRRGALQNLIQVTQDYKVNLLAVQEVRQLGISILEKKVKGKVVPLQA